MMVLVPNVLLKMQLVQQVIKMIIHLQQIRNVFLKVFIVLKIIKMMELVKNAFLPMIHALKVSGIMEKEFVFLFKRLVLYHILKGQMVHVQPHVRLDSKLIFPLENVIQR